MQGFLGFATRAPFLAAALLAVVPWVAGHGNSTPARTDFIRSDLRIAGPSHLTDTRTVDAPAAPVRSVASLRGELLAEMDAARPPGRRAAPCPGDTGAYPRIAGL